MDFQPLLQSAKASPVRHATDNTELNKRWSVQVSAAPVSDIASALAERIKANGLRRLRAPGRGERTDFLSRACRTFRNARRGGISTRVVSAP